MNKTISKWFAALVLLFVASVGYAQTLTIEDFDINPGDTKTVNIVLKAEGKVYGVQTDITLPAGLTIAETPVAIDGIMEDGSNATLVSNELTGKLRVALYSATFKAFKDAKNGLPVIKLTVKAAADLTNRPAIQLSGSKVTAEDEKGNQVEENVANDEAVADAQVYSYTLPATLEFNPATDKNVRAYASDKAEGELSGLQEVFTGDFRWTPASNGDARAAAVFAVGGAAKLEGAAAPATNAFGRVEGNVLGLFAVWTATTQYTQEIALKAGTYYLAVPVFNAAGTEAIAKNLIGVEGAGVKVYAETTQYPVGEWTVETLEFTLAEDATVTFSLGYTAADKGNAEMPRLFVQFVNISTVPGVKAILSLDEVEAKKAYTIKSEFDGAFIVKDGKVTTTTEANVKADAADANQQFAFVKNAGNGNTYLYSVGAKKFVNLAGVADFDLAGGTTETAALAATPNVFFPTTLALNGTVLGVDNAVSPAVKAGATEVAIAWAADFDDEAAQAAMVPPVSLAGNYMLYNVGRGRFFTKGNGWGTQASITEDNCDGNAIAVELIAVGEKFQIRTGIANNAYGLEALSGGTVYTDQSRGKQSTWEFKPITTANGIVYNIVSADNHGDGAGKYMSANAENTIVGPADNGDSPLAQWKLVSLDNFDDVLAEMAAATEAAPVDASALIVNRQFSFPTIKKDAWTMVANNYNPNGGAGTNPCAESWQSAFNLSQQLTAIPNGVYKLTVQAALTDYTNAYDGVDYPVAFANDATTPFIAMEAADRGSSMTQLSGSFTAGKYNVEPIYVMVTDNTLTVGVKGTRTNTWCIWDNFQLAYYGATATINGARLGVVYSQVNELIAEAEALKANELVPADNVFALGHALDIASLLDPNAPTALDDYNNAKTALTSAVEAAKVALAAAEAVQEAANELKATVAKMEAVVADADKYIDENGVAANVAAALAEVKAATYTSQEAVDNGTSAAQAAFATFLSGVTMKENLDITEFFIVNAYPYASNALPNGWEGTKFGTGSNGVSEYWGPNTGGSSFYQTINLPAGTYKLTAIALTRTGMVGTIFANDFTAEIATVGNDVVNNRAQAEAWFNDGNGVNELVFTLEEATAVKIGLKSDETTGDHWTVWRDFSLELVSTYVDALNSIAAEDQNAAKAIYDLTGRRVAKATKGIFIINGKKVVK